MDGFYKKSEWRDESSDNGGWYKGNIPRALHAVALFRHINLPSMLPAAMFICCEELQLIHLAKYASDPPIQLNMASDIAIMIEAFQKLVRREWKQYLTLFPTIHRNLCLNGGLKPSCGEHRIQYISSGFCAPAGKMELLVEMEEEDWETLAHQQSICQGCLTCIKGTWKAGMKKVWHDLPGFFQLGHWDGTEGVNMDK
jgi:hypothetical protein